MKKVLFFSLLLCMLSCSKDKDCNPGFTGSDCDQELVPRNISLYAVYLVEFPQTDNGAGWDILDGPDVYFTISYNGTKIYDGRENYRLNALAPPPLLWDISTNVNFDHPDDTYSISAWDRDDTSSDDFIGGITFVPYRKNQGFPPELYISCAQCNTTWKINVGYTH